MRDLEQGHESDERRRRAPARQRETEQRAGSFLGAPRPRKSLDAGSVLGLQRSVGNQATTAYLQRLELQRDQDEEGAAGGGESSPVHDAIGRSGSPIDKSIRGVMEPVLQTSLSDVQVVPDRVSTSSVNASAYTVGNKVVVNPDHFSSGTPQAQRTLFHELTHVKQQREGPVAGTPQAGGIQVSSPEDRFEQEAERTADHAMGMQRQTLEQAHHDGDGDGHDHGEANGGVGAPLALQRVGESEEEGEE
jgi:hypothetical protein